MVETLLYLGGFAAILWVAYWYLEVYTPRKHWREACEEVEAMYRWQRAYRAPPRPPK